MTGDREADRLLIQADQLRRLAEELENRAAEIRPTREQLNHRRTFDLLAERDGAHCRYCCCTVHPYDPDHIQVADGDGIVSCVEENEWGVHPRCAHIDNVIPHRHNGINHIDNLALARRQCNTAKRDRTPIEWHIDDSHRGADYDCEPF